MYVPLCFVRTYIVEHRTAFDGVIRSCFETLRDFYLELAIVITVVSYFSKISFFVFVCTHINVDPSEGKYLRGWHFGGRVSVKLVAPSVPLHGVQRCVCQLV